MSWGDQMMDEFGMIGEKKKSKLDMDKRKTLLAMFAIHMASKYSLPFDEAVLDAEIDEFLKTLEGEPKKGEPNNKQVQKRKTGKDEEGEEVHYLG